MKLLSKRTHKLFREIDEQMLNLQELLCKDKVVHRADQVDILRRAMSQVLYQEMEHRKMLGKK